MDGVASGSPPTCHQSRALHGRGVKMLGGLHTALFPAPHPPPPTPIGSGCRRFEKQTHSDSYLLADSKPGLGELRVFGILPQRQRRVAGRQYLTQWDIPKMGGESVTKARNRRNHPTDGDRCLALANFSKSRFLVDLGFIQRNSVVQEGWG